MTLQEVFVKQRKLGGQGLEVSEIGLGCMRMSEFYGTTDEDEATATLHRALDLGVTLLDTADMYGPFTNEKLVGEAIKSRREEVILATKFGNVRGKDGSFKGIDGSPSYVKRACDASLTARSGLHRPLLPAPRRPRHPDRRDRRGDERAGRRGESALGLSEAGPQTIRKVNDIFPISALQTEYSLFTRDVEDEILPTVRDLGSVSSPTARWDGAS